MSSLVENYAAALLAGPLGEFKKENLEVTYQRLTSTDTYLAMNQGKVQLLASGVSASLLNLLSQKNNLRQVGFSFELPSDSKEGLWVRHEYFNADGSVNKDKVKGMKFNFGTGGYASPIIVPDARWLKEQGLSVKDVSGTELAGADALAALKAGAVGASYVQSPFWQQIEKEGYARLIPGSGFSLASYIMETNFMKTQPDVARAILRALLRTQRTYLQGDYHANDLVVEALSKATSSPVETIKATPAMIWNTDLQPTPTMLRNIAEAQADWLEVGGVLQYTDPLPMDRINDLSIVNEVIAGK